MRHGPASLNRHRNHEAALPFGHTGDLKIVARLNRNGGEGLAIDCER